MDFRAWTCTVKGELVKARVSMEIETEDRKCWERGRSIDGRTPVHLPRKAECLPGPLLHTGDFPNELCW